MGSGLTEHVMNLTDQTLQSLHEIDLYNSIYDKTTPDHDFTFVYEVTDTNIQELQLHMTLGTGRFAYPAF